MNTNIIKKTSNLLTSLLDLGHFLPSGNFSPFLDFSIWWLEPRWPPGRKPEQPQAQACCLLCKFSLSGTKPGLRALWIFAYMIVWTSCLSPNVYPCSKLCVVCLWSIYITRRSQLSYSQASRWKTVIGFFDGFCEQCGLIVT